MHVLWGQNYFNVRSVYLVKDESTDSHFGIDGSHERDYNCYIGERRHQYGIGCGCFEYEKWRAENTDIEFYGLVPEMYTGETITMELNCIDKSLNYQANDDIENTFGFKNICLENMEYVMAVSLSYEHDCVELIKYEQVKLM